MDILEPGLNGVWHGAPWSTLRRWQARGVNPILDRHLRDRLHGSSSTLHAVRFNVTAFRLASACDPRFYDRCQFFSDARF